MTSENRVSRTADTSAKSEHAILGKRLHPAGQSGNTSFLRVCRPRLTRSSIWRASVRACVFWIWHVALGARPSTAAKRVGPSGSVVARDISATMLDHVRQSAAAGSLQNIETLECPADELDETLPPFDAAISRLGLMLFPSPSRALKATSARIKARRAFCGTSLYYA